MALKFLDANGEGNTADAANAIDYAVNHGARVINASWGGPAFSQALYQAIKRAGEQGVLVVAAAGNDGVNADSDARLPGRASTSRTSSRSRPPTAPTGCWTSRTTAPNRSTSPPRATTSTRPCRPTSDPSGYASFSGTSMAAPFVSRRRRPLPVAQFPQATVDQVARGDPADASTSFPRSRARPSPAAG